MLNDIKVTKIEAVNGCTRIQIDILNKDTDEEYRVFIKTEQFFKVFYNQLSENEAKYQEKHGWQHIDEVKINKRDLIK